MALKIGVYSIATATSADKKTKRKFYAVVDEEGNTIAVLCHKEKDSNGTPPSLGILWNRSGSLSAALRDIRTRWEGKDDIKHVTMITPVEKRLNLKTPANTPTPFTAYVLPMLRGAYACMLSRPNEQDCYLCGSADELSKSMRLMGRWNKMVQGKKTEPFNFTARFQLRGDEYGSGPFTYDHGCPIWTFQLLDKSHELALVTKKWLRRPAWNVIHASPEDPNGSKYAILSEYRRQQDQLLLCLVKTMGCWDSSLGDHQSFTQPRYKY